MRATVFGIALTLLASMSATSIQQRSVNPQPSAASSSRTARALAQAESDLAELNKAQQAYGEAADKLAVMYSQLAKRVDAVSKASAALTPGKAEAGSPGGLQAAIKEMQQLHASYVPQYLQLQQELQTRRRLMSTLSNVLKTRHDTVKNSINNVR